MVPIYVSAADGSCDSKSVRRVVSDCGCCSVAICFEIKVRRPRKKRACLI